jgi:hypothetical protein
VSEKPNTAAAPGGAEVRCFWCGASDVQHLDPCEPACIGGEDEGQAMDAALERAAQELAEETRLAAEEERNE